MLTFVAIAAVYRPRRQVPWASAKRRNAGGRGFGNKPATPPPNAPDSGQSTAPLPSGYKEAPDAQTLRSEYERLGIEVPAAFGAAEADQYDAAGASDADGTLPEVVAARMGRRMAAFAGVPFTFLFLFFATYFVLTYRFEIRVIPAVVAYSTLSLIGLAGVGITYGIMSSSWDPDVEGSRIGWKEAQLNFFRARDALQGQKRREEQGDEFERLDRLAKKAGIEVGDGEDEGSATEK